MRKVLLYTDNDSFAGCENMITVLLDNKEFRDKFDVTLYYRGSRAYKKGLSARLKSLVSTQPLPLVVITRSYLPLRFRNNIFFRLALRMIAIVSLPITYLINAAVLYISFLLTDRDVIIINNGGYPGAKSCLQAAVIAKFLGFRTIIMVVNNTAEIQKDGFKKTLINLYDSFVFRAIDIIITGSIPTSIALKAARRIGDTELLIVPNGISTERFEAAQIADRRTKVLVSGHVVSFSIIGLHEVRKGHMVLFKALAELISRRADLKDRLILNIEGYGDLTQSFVAFANENNLSSIVEFHGRVDNISKFYRDTDVLVVPSLFSEDLPNVISEAMLFGIPTLGSNLAGIPSQISDGVNGFLFEAGDVSTLSQRMEDLIDKPEILNDMSKKCVDKFNLHYNSHIAVSRYTDLISEKI